MVPSANKYLYNGKELQDEMLGSVNLDWYDYGARFYDPALGRWHTQDILSEYHFNVTPYHYTFNNPILFIDPFGLDTIPVNPDGSQVPIPLPGVDVSPTSNPATDNGTWWDGVVRFLWRVEYGISGNHNNSKNRDATKGEEWMIRHFDQSEVKDIGEAVGGNSGAQNSNTVNTDASYEGRSDEDIIEEAGGNNKDLIERKKRRTLPEPTQELEVFYRNRRTRTDSLNWIVNQDTFKVARKVKGGVIRYDFGYHEE